MSSSQRLALLSVSDKTNLAPFAAGLVKLGFRLISTGGTKVALEQAGLPVTEVSAHTGFPEMMEGRLKTLHPKIHGGLLGRPTKPSDAASMAEHDIQSIELVVVNLYPFVETISRPGVTLPEAIEQIDIGGPSMVRSAAKNHAHVAIVTSPAQYADVLTKLETGVLTLEDRQHLAAAAFETTARYDRAIADYLSGQFTPASSAAFPDKLSLSFNKVSDLRYGENPHQRAAFYRELSPATDSLAAAETLHGKELSYNNLLDLDAALMLVNEFASPACAVIKHNNPCGCATAEALVEAYLAADASDPVSAFGSIIGFNRIVDLATAEELVQPSHFIEAIIAPGFSPEALACLTTKPKWKNSVRLVACGASTNATSTAALDYRRVSGGLLVQDRDAAVEEVSTWKTVTKRAPTSSELHDLQFGWKVCKHVKSNAILLAKGGATIGVGAGQMSRLDSAMISATKAGSRAHGAIAASDAFFPFRDGVDQLHQAGIRAIVQPGGSKRDDEVIAACDEYGIAMLFTGLRHFKH
jgi:phosphoribosylaminoimidazolecarboxamide formyltransferase / IMP cyclohydrolase